MCADSSFQFLMCAVWPCFIAAFFLSLDVCSTYLVTWLSCVIWLTWRMIKHHRWSASTRSPFYSSVLPASFRHSRAALSQVGPPVGRRTRCPGWFLSIISQSPGVSKSTRFHVDLPVHVHQKPHCAVAWLLPFHARGFLACQCLSASMSRLLYLDVDRVCSEFTWPTWIG